MIIYCYILLGLQLVSLGVSLKENGSEIVKTFLGMALLFPLIGRILGWF